MSLHTAEVGELKENEWDPTKEVIHEYIARRIKKAKPEYRLATREIKETRAADSLYGGSSIAGIDYYISGKTTFWGKKRDLVRMVYKHPDDSGDFDTHCVAVYEPGLLEIVGKALKGTPWEKK